MKRLIKAAIALFCGVLPAFAAQAQTSPTMLERHLLQQRIVHTERPDVLMVAIGEAFFDLRMQVMGVNVMTMPGMTEALKAGGQKTTYTGTMMDCAAVMDETAKASGRCKENVTVELSRAAPGKYLIKLVIGEGAQNLESYDKTAYRRYFEAIGKSLFLENAGLALDAPEQM